MAGLILTSAVASAATAISEDYYEIHMFDRLARKLFNLQWLLMPAERKLKLRIYRLRRDANSDNPHFGRIWNKHPEKQKWPYDV